ncbi:OmpA family protein [Candidatus Nitrosacidococcus sp. I8]|uniref:OmpA family protein n=1 Tax=Candidatus Nitrosacidococcus sp. I8 TaxID=2942908 RepID=UPI00222658CC|nr:OmpA family protein [Candidatus Nitrosacidococcus sp. I8]CAH9019122.1 Peptidoglycan-associated lipoprotein [Candidatus Nitrosacidococcus sp. I8]
MNNRDITKILVILPILFITCASAQQPIERDGAWDSYPYEKDFKDHKGWPDCAVMEGNSENKKYLPGKEQVITWTICRSDTPDSDHDGVPDHIDQCPDTPEWMKVDKKGCPLDTDGDGVPDSVDQCINTPKGARVNGVGCTVKDSDGDGVPDSADQCPNTPKGVAVDSVGCPLDSDGDGIADYLDQCPNTPEGITVNNQGCPGPAVLKGVHFEFDSAQLTLDAQGILNNVAQSLQSHPELNISIAGHTDSTGPEIYNKQLSQLRAESVMNYLASHGVDKAKMTAMGYGEEHPIASNLTQDGRAQNRRVELQTSN